MPRKRDRGQLTPLLVKHRSVTKDYDAAYFPDQLVPRLRWEGGFPGGEIATGGRVACGNLLRAFSRR